MEKDAETARIFDGLVAPLAGGREHLLYMRLKMQFLKEGNSDRRDDDIYRMGRISNEYSFAFEQVGKRLAVENFPIADSLCFAIAY